ncbi:hypothetical protein MRX96_008720 [Rhipicephalus microplus]
MATDGGTGTAGTSSRTKANKRRYCCVKDCHSREGQPGIRLYRFPGQPWEKERRRKWIVAVRRVNEGDGSAWIPSDAARVCSKHFVNGEKSNIATHPGYYPTIFPDACKSRPVDAGRALSRYERWNRRASAARSAKPENPRTNIDFGDSEDTALNTTCCTSSATSSACVNGLDLLCAAAALAQEQTADQACQTDDADTCGRLVGFLCCMNGHDESTQRPSKMFIFPAQFHGSRGAPPRQSRRERRGFRPHHSHGSLRGTGSDLSFFPFYLSFSFPTL